VSGVERSAEIDRMPVGDLARLRWWRFLDHFHRCSECGHWPDAHRDGIAPRWENDKVAHMLGIARYGCRRCGHGAIEERDSRAAVIEELATEAELWADDEDDAGDVLAEWLRRHISPGPEQPS
jgi:hypothetical protein